MEIIKNNFNTKDKVVACRHCDSVLKISKSDLFMAPFDNGRESWDEEAFICPCCQKINFEYKVITL